MPSPPEQNPTAATPQDQRASASGARDDTAPHGAGEPKFGPPAARGEIGVLGPYRVVKKLGAGGMGAVYLAVDTRLNRKLALKVMLPACAADPQARERFLREARAAAQITHDNVVTVFEADEREGVPYIGMQFLQGYPLDEYLKNKGAPPLSHVIRIGREAALGLAAAHELGLVHRDIKPANLWLEAPNGRVKVLDFGLAKPLGTDAEVTKSGAVLGTPAYMSPEQARGSRVDHRTDLWSLGVLLYRLCTGQNPFVGPNVMAVLLALATEEPAPVRRLNPHVPESLAQLIHQLLAKRSEHRPQTAAEVAERLHRALAELLDPNAPGTAAPRGSPEQSVSRPVVLNPVPHQPPVVVPMYVTMAPESVFAGLDGAGDDTQTEPAATSARPRESKTAALVLPLAAVAVALLAAGVLIAVIGRSNSRDRSATTPTPTSVEPVSRPPERPQPKPVPSEPAPPGERRYTPAEIAEGRVVLPEPSQILRADTFQTPVPTRSGYVYTERGRFSINTDGTLWWRMGATPPTDFACEAVLRVTGAPGERGGLVLGVVRDTDSRAMQVLLNPTGELTVDPWFYSTDAYKAGAPKMQAFRPKSARPADWNTLTVIVRGKVMELYLNRVAVSNPIEWPGPASECLLQGLGRDPSGRVVFTSVRFWSTAGVPTPFQTK